ncbi:MAG TPA: ornithine carbamoyltransferase [Candidatus Omnitrophota bacterium]|jgi:ornithine carbamoyltransferase|nr:ornithine carbamoyltransferase [Candidatus Omnitrophota bacterium]HPN56179.1 ornithine carbamoyltransferase [Candidatus Omnitrophota bacterium]
MKKDLLSIHDLKNEEIHYLLKEAVRLKADRHGGSSILKDKTVALIFQKPSNRTRVSFEVGIHQLGGKCLYLGPGEINLGKRESTSDVAATLSRYLDGIVARTFKHDDIVELSRTASIPIINGLSDLYHPCQALADLMSIQEKFSELQGLKLAYIGDGNNVCHSLILGCAKVGMNVSVATPPGYEPDSGILAMAQNESRQFNASVTLTHCPQEAAQGAHVIYTDVWTSMGQEEEHAARLKIFHDFQVNTALISKAHDHCVFMHCLPAHRGEEVTAEVIDGPRSIVFDQAENRLHIQKAILLFIFS